MSLLEELQFALIRILPKHTFSRWAGKFARSRVSRRLIPLYASWFRVNTGEAGLQIGKYSSLQEFFTRKLKPGARRIEGGAETVVSPVDGVVAELGRIDQGTLVQAKGVAYTVAELLGGDISRALGFNGGQYLTIYLSPRDYHRIHLPIDGKVTGCAYIPGTLWPVNSLGVRKVPGLFARNERLITYLDTPAGVVAVVKVGAAGVGSVRVVYEQAANAGGRIVGQLGTNLRGGKPAQCDLPAGPFLAKGEELGYFEFGSTVILLWQPERVCLDPALSPGQPIRMGQAIGRVAN